MSRSLRILGPAGSHAEGRDRWYDEGIRFSCTGSGRCCTVHGDYAYVFLTRNEERRIADHLGISRRRLRHRHTHRTSDGARSLRFPAGRCTFLRGRRCSIYDVRPHQCRAWPFWQENLDPVMWKTEIAPFCPGVGRGRLYSAEEIDAVATGGRDVTEAG